MQYLLNLVAPPPCIFVEGVHVSLSNFGSTGRLGLGQKRLPLQAYVAL